MGFQNKGDEYFIVKCDDINMLLSGSLFQNHL